MVRFAAGLECPVVVASEGSVRLSRTGARAGSIAIAVMLIDKRGIWGALQNRFSLSIFPTGHWLPPDQRRPVP